MSEFSATVGKMPNSKEFVRLPDLTTAASAAQVTNKAVTAPPIQDGSRDTDCERWGADNRHPLKVRQAVAKVPMVGQSIERRVRMLYGNGLFYYRNEDLQDGNTTITRHYDKEVEKFLRHNRIRTNWYPNQCMDYVTFNNCFTQFSVNPLTNEVSALYHKSAEDCRLSAVGENDGISRYVLYSKHWQQGTTNKENRKAIYLYQWDDRDAFLKNQRAGAYAWHTKGPALGDLSYPQPPHEGLFRKNGWIDVAANVPEIVHAMQTNQITIKYQINVDESYFLFRHPDFDRMTSKKRTKIFDDLIIKITRELTGTDNYLKSIASLTRRDGFENKAKGSIEIIAIDDKAKAGTWIPDSNSADAQIVQGLGNDPSLIGLQPQGGKMGAGSGSDKREGYNIGTEMNTLDQDIILEPLNHAAEMNGWDITFRISHAAHTTLNQNKSGREPDAATLQLEGE